MEKEVNGIKPQSKLWTQNTDSSLQQAVGYYDKIKIEEYVKASEQRLFKDSPCRTWLKKNWVFDYPGIFCSKDNYSFHNVSFREINAYISANCEVVADVYF